MNLDHCPRLAYGTPGIWRNEVGSRCLEFESDDGPFQVGPRKFYVFVFSSCKAYTRLTHSYTCLTVLHLHLLSRLCRLIDSESESCFRVGSTCQCMPGWAHGGLPAHCGDSALPRPRQRTWPSGNSSLACAGYCRRRSHFFSFLSSSLYLMKGLDPLGSPRKPDPRPTVP
jgi:hypothetical protein